MPIEVRCGRRICRFAGMLLATALVTFGPTAAAKVKITGMHWDGYDHVKNSVGKIVEEFNARHPDIELEMLYQPDDFRGKLKTMVAAGNAPDIFRMDDDELAFYALDGAIMPLDKWIARDLNQKEYVWPMFEATYLYGHYYAVVAGVRASAVHYNPDLFDQAGVAHPPAEYPSNNWTWDIFVNTAKKLTRDTNGDGKIDVFGFCGVRSGDWWPTMVWNNGGEIFDYKTQRFLMAEPAAVDAIQYWADLIHRHHAHPTPAEESAMRGCDDAFLSQQAAMFFWLDRPRNATFRWDIAGLPIVPGKRPATLIGVATFVMNAHTKHPEEAWQALRALIDFRGQQLITLDNLYVPSHRGVLKEVYITPNVPPRNDGVLVQGLDYARALPLIPATEDMQRIAWPAGDRVFRGEMSARQAMSAIKGEVEAKLREHWQREQERLGGRR